MTICIIGIIFISMIIFIVGLIVSIGLILRRRINQSLDAKKVDKSKTGKSSRGF